MEQGYAQKLNIHSKQSRARENQEYRALLFPSFSAFLIGLSRRFQTGQQFLFLSRFDTFVQFRWTNAYLFRIDVLIHPSDLVFRIERSLGPWGDLIVKFDLAQTANDMSTQLSSWPPSLVQSGRKELQASDWHSCWRCFYFCLKNIPVFSDLPPPCVRNINRLLLSA